VQGEGTTFAFDLVLPLADSDLLIG
jgi:hypothetical protein